LPGPGRRFPPKGQTPDLHLTECLEGFIMNTQNQRHRAVHLFSDGKRELYDRARTSALEQSHSCSPCSSPSQPLSGSLLSRRILVVHETLPRPDRSGCEARLMQILRMLRAQGHTVSYIARFGKEQDSIRELEELGIRVYAHDAERMGEWEIGVPPTWSLAHLLAEEDFDLAILSQQFGSGISIGEHYLPEIRKFSPRTRAAILSDDRHGLREHLLARVTGDLLDQLRALNIQQREEEVYRAADLVLGISACDIEGFRASLPGLRCDLLPMAAPPVSSAAGFEERNGVLLVGDFQNRANLDAAQWLLGIVWPLAQSEIPELELRIIGRGLPPGLAKNRVGVVALGYVNDLEEAYRQARVFVSPVRFCTGIQTKSLAALAHGLPLVTTPAAAEGLGLRRKKEALFASTAKSFAASIVRLHSDPVLWRNLSRQGRDYVGDQFSERRLAARLQHLAESLGGILPKAYDPSECFSIRRVERECPQAFGLAGSEKRWLVLLEGYLEIAGRYLSQGDARNAQEQLLHIFAFVHGAVPKTDFYARVLHLLEQARNMLGPRGAFPIPERAGKLAPRPFPNRPSTGKEALSGP
jgi:glycosyltransferase involved in cell wall biosynthesis